mmetsp:Transcript_42826/g.31288  ORF Transcript_42826/g.31288 Transcript_42826/m.31288 type:complete len:151 (+) Transcript_42826:781-1233(+)
MDVLENLALLMIVNKEIEEYAKVFEAERKSMERLKKLFGQELMDAEQKVDFQQLHPKLTLPSPSTNNQKATAIQILNLEKKENDLKPPLFQLQVIEAELDYRAEDKKKKLIDLKNKKKVKKYKKVKVARKSTNFINPKALYEEEARLIKQ